MKMVRVMVAAAAMAAGVRVLGQDKVPVDATLERDGKVGIFQADTVTWVPAGSTEAKAAEAALAARRAAVAIPAGRGEERPAVLATGAMDKKVRGQWEEDLEVMGKLVGDAIRGTGEFRTQQAMGIFVRAEAGPEPVYVEGFGVIVMGSVNWPLAGEEKPAAEPKGSGAKVSAWDQAKQSLYAGQNAEAQARAQKEKELLRQRAEAQGGSEGKRVTATLTISGKSSLEPLGPTAGFSKERVDLLKKGLVAALAEGTHFRQLAPEEVVMVTVSGRNEVGQAVRLTLKARKEDMDAVAAGKMTMEEFGAKTGGVVE
jgi:hypothetical protein